MIEIEFEATNSIFKRGIVKRSIDKVLANWEAEEGSTEHDAFDAEEIRKADRKPNNPLSFDDF